MSTNTQPAAGPTQHGHSIRDRFQAMMRTVGMLPVLILVVIIFGFLADSFFTFQNFSIIAQQASINTVLAAGMTFVILTAGIDLSVGSVLAAAAVVTVMASTLPAGGLLGVLAALVTGLAFGLINGSLVAFAKLPFIVTLGALTAVRGIARLIGDDKTAFNPDLPFAFIGSDTSSECPGW